MKLREKMKRFWTLDVHNHEGFTLVELIIVIAILAILSTSGIAGYSAYVQHANMVKDQAMVADIVNALTLAYYNGDITGNGYVILSTTDAPDCGNNAEITAALQAVYGENGMAGLKLRYKDWNIQYSQSSFAGSESELLGKVDNLTGILSTVLEDHPELMGDRFQAYLSKLGLDPSNPEDATAISQAAVLYVAQNMGNADKAAWVDSVANLPTSGLTNAMAICEAWLPYFNNSYLDVAAALYATAEAYCRYEQNVHGKPEPMNVLNRGIDNMDTAGVTSGFQAVLQVFNAFAQVQALVLRNEPENYHFYKYFEDGQARKDAEAYVGIMSTISGAESAVTENLGQPDYFTSSEVNNMFNVYSQGGVIVVVEFLSDGTVDIKNPLE